MLFNFVSSPSLNTMCWLKCCHWFNSRHIRNWKRIRPWVWGWLQWILLNSLCSFKGKNDSLFVRCYSCWLLLLIVMLVYEDRENGDTSQIDIRFVPSLSALFSFSVVQDSLHLLVTVRCFIKLWGLSNFAVTLPDVESQARKTWGAGVISWDTRCQGTREEFARGER